MPSWKDYRGQSIGLARVMSEEPYSDGTTAQLIKNFLVDEQGYLDSTYRIMPFIPFEWNDGNAPLAFSVSVMAMKFIELNGEKPEILFLTSTGVYKYAPWTRMPYASNQVNNGLEEQKVYRIGQTAKTISPQTSPQYPPQMEVSGNRIYFSFCDGGGLWVWDGVKIRSFGYTQRPAAILAAGPQRAPTVYDASGAITDTGINRAGFTHAGRIGTTASEFVANDAVVTGVTYRVAGGVDTSSYQYAVAFENQDGAYSERSSNGSKVSIEMEVVEDGKPIENLLRKFRLLGIPKGPEGTVARILLRTYNLHRLPSGSNGEYRILHRIANNTAIEYIDDIPDGELGIEWKERGAIPTGIFFMRAFSGSFWLLRTSGYPARVWWSEQEEAGPIPESFLKSHWLDVFPGTGAITATAMSNIPDDQKGMLLVFKENSTHYITGTYPNWVVGTLHQSAGCAGPELVQAVPDGSLVWYGSGTFWKLLPGGAVTDIGSAIRKRLRSVNDNRSRLGVSWIDREFRETIFVLPMDDSNKNNMQFIWDYQAQGWRIREDIIVDAAISLPYINTTLLSGSVTVQKNTYGVIQPIDEVSVWAYNRSYPLFVTAPRESEFHSGWFSLSGLGPKLHSANRATQIVLTAEERSSGLATVSTFEDWNTDDIIGSPISIGSSHPENDNIPYYGVSEYDNAVYRDRRVYGEKVGIDISSQSVHSIKIVTLSPIALYNIDIWGPIIAGAGARTPTRDP